MSNPSFSPSRPGRWRARLMPVLWIVLAALLIRSLVVQPFSIPSGSMLPTLQVGDYLFVSKGDYGWSRFSLPFALPLPQGRIFSTMPERGDIVVFRLPTNNRIDYIKRVIALPGDEVQMRRGQVLLNGAPLVRMQTGTRMARIASRPAVRALLYREMLPGGPSYETLDIIRNAPRDNTQIFRVPKDHVFVMGDNRDNSNDSRADIGFVPVDHLVGQARMIYFSAEQGRFWQFWRWPGRVRAERLGMVLQ